MQIYIWLTERLYNEFAWFYDTASWIVSLGHWNTWRSSANDLLKGTEILEIGFGTGELLIEMTKRNFHVFGIDSSQAMVNITKKKLRRRNLELPVIRGLIGQMPFKDHSFDTILSTFPADYIFDPATWREVARLLQDNCRVLEKAGGQFVIIGLYVSYTGKLQFHRNHTKYDHACQDIFDRITKLANSVDLSLRIETRIYSNHQLPILIADRYNSLN